MRRLAPGRGARADSPIRDERRDLVDHRALAHRRLELERATSAAAGERGSTLAIVVMAAATLAMLGLGVLALGSLESQAALDALATRQASLAAVSGLDLVKHWFDAPRGTSAEWLVPEAGEVDRSGRRVDPDGDGTSEPALSAPPPWNVLYREGRGDLFERPYEGNPSLRLEGDSRGPDVAIDETSPESAARALLLRLNAALFPHAPGSGLALRLTRIAILAPPRARIDGQMRRIGVGTIEVTAIVVRTSADGETVLASARAAGVLQDIPYALRGPVSTSGDLEAGEGIDARWGEVRVGGVVDLGADPRSRARAGWPRRPDGRRLVLDADGDGTSDDLDRDGTADLDEWLALADAGLVDPWYGLFAGSAIAGAPAGRPQPYPFDAALLPGAYTSDDDRSGLFQGLGASIALPPDAPLFRAAASDGGAGVHLFRYVPGSDPPRFREGSAAPIDLASATNGREGLFVFDTADGLPPRDEDGDGAADNLTPTIVVGDPDWSMTGCLVVNAASLVLPASSCPLERRIAPPGEPVDDVDGDGTCGEGDSFLALTYPDEPLAPGAEFARIGVRRCGESLPSASGPLSLARLTVAGVILASGRLEEGAGTRIHGGISAAGAILGPDPPAPLQVLFDARLARGEWPPPTMRLPRTTWQRRSVSR